jgi:hypothetical protein
MLSALALHPARSPGRRRCGGTRDRREPFVFAKLAAEHLGLRLVGGLLIGQRAVADGRRDERLVALAAETRSDPLRFVVALWTRREASSAGVIGSLRTAARASGAVALLVIP